MKLAKTLLDRMKGALLKHPALSDNPNDDAKKNVLGAFYDVRFLILVPRFDTLQQQTAVRVKDAGLIHDGEEMTDRVIQYDEGKHEKAFDKFRTDALFERDKLLDKDCKEASVLFVLIADECHWGPTIKGKHDTFLNDLALVEAPNVLMLLVSATPYNVLTSCSRLDQSNVVRWFEDPDEATEYRAVARAEPVTFAFTHRKTNLSFRRIHGVLHGNNCVQGAS